MIRLSLIEYIYHFPPHDVATFTSQVFFLSCYVLHIIYIHPVVQMLGAKGLVSFLTPFGLSPKYFCVGCCFFAILSILFTEPFHFFEPIGTRQSFSSTKLWGIVNDIRPSAMNSIHKHWPYNRTSYTHGKKPPAAISSIHNRTLGFGKIYYINLEDRPIYDDVLVLQSHFTNLSLTQIVATTPEEITLLEKESFSFGIRPAKMTTRACFRSHSNVWRTMLEEGLQSALILEADAMWDAKIKSMMARFSEELESTINSLASHNPKSRSEKDPYLADEWDYLQLSGCYPTVSNPNKTYLYHDSYGHGPSRQEQQGTEELSDYKYQVATDTVLSNQRLIRRNSVDYCLSGYAISRRGAAKLLLKSMYMTKTPVDIVAMQAVLTGQLTNYAVYPPMIAQWAFRKGANLEDRNSDIDLERDLEKVNKTQESETEDLGDLWLRIKKEGNVWRYRDPYSETGFKDPVLFKLKKHAFGN